jgi:hypothetical protein
MIEEVYVSFEVAKLFKEKGFDGECSSFYTTSGTSRWEYQHYHDFDIRDRIECTTQAMAMRWLRECHNISIEINSFWNGSDNDEFRFSNYTYGFRVDTPNFTDRYRKSAFESYEEAVEAAIKYCLENLI